MAYGFIRPQHVINYDTAQKRYAHTLSHALRDGDVRRTFCIHTIVGGPHNEESTSLVTGQNQQHWCHVSKSLLLILTRCAEGLRRGAHVGDTYSTGEGNPGDFIHIKSSRRAEAIT